LKSGKKSSYFTRIGSFARRCFRTSNYFAIFCVIIHFLGTQAANVFRSVKNVEFASSGPDFSAICLTKRLIGEILLHYHIHIWDCAFVQNMFLIIIENKYNWKHFFLNANLNDGKSTNFGFRKRKLVWVLITYYLPRYCKWSLNNIDCQELVNSQSDFG
jgi:hypothetical protein